CMQSLEIPPTF
nr:immunoglobulin light chain junction region [Macaca mulatta]MOV77542.1 immunoglobulin light chain junction region [Macaca mulatta]MOV77679.1 immunoglobulin light chain junction region [Macaca mulatta]MOV77892.1 immunoglobulin light chain junction region [Macaca mulatta]MOV77902.1 immunoglobulin light chain junction region [Macaca mulatta]